MMIDQVMVGDKESEIIAARSFFDRIEATGARVAGDALHCQGKTGRLITDRGGEWLVTLKANRQVQHGDVRAWFADSVSRPDAEHTTTDAHDDRIEVNAIAWPR